jgi:hypothetical protein
MSQRRSFTDSPIPQGTNERIRYQIDTTRYGGAPENVVLTVVDTVTNQVVTNTVASGSPDVVGNVITLPPIHSLVPGHEYRFAVRFDAGGHTWEPYGLIRAEA